MKEIKSDFQLPVRHTYCIRELASIFSTSQQHWINLIERGHLRAINLSTPGAKKSMLRVEREELLRFLETRKP